ncbi:MAG: PhnD/SsuA/transferrin family substrate-binding protein [Burkholderiales bacterium]|nr:PhnD/SsuA/transferrin family substrate-binding protein [Burkholderiales bacterium]
MLLGIAAPAWADLSVLVAIEPTARKDGLMVSRTGLESGLSKLMSEPVTVTTSDDLTDAMRATRSGGYDVFIAPAQVAASAIGHGYELIGSTDPAEEYLLIGSKEVGDVADLRRRRIYLPQQDSLYTYLARGLLNASSLSFKDLGRVQYARYPQAGLTAIELHQADATLVRREDWEPWSKDSRTGAKVLAKYEGVPGGFSVVVKKDLDAGARAQLTKWFAAPLRNAGIRPVAAHAELDSYRKVAQLGTFTPTDLAGATLVGVAEVRRLMSQGVILVDTRNQQEYAQRHIPGARFVPYGEKSLKDVAYDAALDDFAGLKSLDPNRPTIFQCNGPECWKSYKAARAAIGAGFKKVYWFRGGMPAWEAANLQTASGL